MRRRYIIADTLAALALVVYCFSTLRDNSFECALRIVLV